VLVQILRIGSEGEAVRRWQQFLIGHAFFAGPVDGLYGPRTDRATRRFQTGAQLDVDGCVGPLTYAAALCSGFDAGFVDPQGGTSGVEWPPRPVFSAIVSNEERATLFGSFVYERIKPNRDEIRILDDWESQNIVTAVIPQLVSVEGAPAKGRIRIHGRVAEQTIALFDVWEKDGLSKLVLSWGGSFVPRFVRGSTATLSSHAWGSAFDINVPWNRLGCVPALRSQKGSVRELVKRANELGFYWGGHFQGRADGMHFEVARPLD
jgi:peptidoglycan hydrolase-like protein with peptidoglycan-binding domain